MKKSHIFIIIAIIIIISLFLLIKNNLFEKETLISEDKDIQLTEEEVLLKEMTNIKSLEENIIEKRFEICDDLSKNKKIGCLSFVYTYKILSEDNFECKEIFNYYEEGNDLYNLCRYIQTKDKSFCYNLEEDSAENFCLNLYEEEIIEKNDEMNTIKMMVISKENNDPTFCQNINFLEDDFFKKEILNNLCKLILEKKIN